MADKDKSGRKINTGGGSYIEGGVNTGGGDFVGRDQYKQQAGASLADLTRLVAEIRALLPQANLEADVQEAIEGDFQVVETQLAKPEPKKALVLPKLETIAKMLSGAAAAGEAVQKLAPMVQQAAQWAQQLLK